ncbi:MAG TPA: SRPBCC family protein [Propionibacteriaceae bacterium]|nr:SRPBCC family protein [Propionibacteriaceae bacterium]
MGAVDYSVWIQASPEQVWRVYVDPSRIPEWQTGSPVIEEIHGRADEPGSTYVSRRRPGAARTTVTEAEKPSCLMTITEAYFGLRFDVRSLLTPQSGVTLLGLQVETLWPRGLGLLGKPVEVAILSPREGQKELARLKALIESDLRP